MPQHAPAARWYASLDDAALLFCRFTMPGFLRLLTNRKAMGGSTSTLAGALQLYDRWTQDPRVELVAEPRGAEAFFRQAAAPFAGQPATKAIADCYLAGFAEAAGAHLVTLGSGGTIPASASHAPGGGRSECGRRAFAEAQAAQPAILKLTSITPWPGLPSGRPLTE